MLEKYRNVKVVLEITSNFKTKYYHLDNNMKFSETGDDPWFNQKDVSKNRELIKKEAKKILNNNYKIEDVDEAVIELTNFGSYSKIWKIK